MNQGIRFLAQRRRDAGCKRPSLCSDLCASAPLREVVLVAAEGRAVLFASFVVSRSKRTTKSARTTDHRVRATAPKPQREGKTKNRKAEGRAAPPQ